MVIGVAAHADRPIRQIAEHSAAVLPGNGSLSPAAHGMTQFCALKGVRLCFFDGDPQSIRSGVITFYNALQFLAGMVGIPQVRDGGVPQIPLGEIDVMTIALHQAPPGANRQHPAFGPRPLPV